MAESQKLAGLDGIQSVSALGLRWAALRGMLTSPLIMGDDQRSLREELMHELGSIERDFSALQSRNTTEISAKVDIAKSALRERIQAGETWMIDLLDSIQADLHGLSPKAAPNVTPRPPVNLARTNQPRSEENGTQANPETSTPSAA